MNTSAKGAWQLLVTGPENEIHKLTRLLSLLWDQGQLHLDSFSVADPDEH